MPENLKEIRSRIQFYSSAQQMTKAMKLVSAVKFKKATEASAKLRPYETQISKIFDTLSSQVDIDFQMPLTEMRPVKRILIVVVSSERGLCGGHNAQIFKLAEKVIRQNCTVSAQSDEVYILPLGKKAAIFFKNKQYRVNEITTMIPDVPKFDDIRDLSMSIQQDFKSGKYDLIEIISSKFKNAIKYDYTVSTYLPLLLQRKDQDTSDRYIYDSPAEEMLSKLIPSYLDCLFYNIVLQSKTSEHAARMMAMDKATENAKELLSSLKLSYNRARQAAITKELTEIINGMA